MLQKNGEEIARLIAEKIDTDTTFHSLEVIKSFIKEELEKRGITSVII
jgi:predicted GNAT family acetyltransferase